MDVLTNMARSAPAPRLSSVSTREHTSLDPDRLSTTSPPSRTSNTSPRRRVSFSSSESKAGKRISSTAKTYLALAFGFSRKSPRQDDVQVDAGDQSTRDHILRERCRLLQVKLKDERSALAELKKMLDAQSATNCSEESVKRVNDLAARQVRLEADLKRRKNGHHQLGVALRLVCDAMVCLESAMRSCRKDVFLLGLLGVRAAFRTNDDWTKAARLRETALTHLLQFPEIHKLATEDNCLLTLQALNVITDSAATDMYILRRLDESYEELRYMRDAITEVEVVEREEYHNTRRKVHANRMRVEQGQADMVLEHFTMLRVENVED